MTFFGRDAVGHALVVFLAASLLSGCLTMMETEGDKRKPIAIGMSTETVKARFGPPSEVNASGRGNQSWEYILREPCYDCESGWETISVDLEFGEYGTLQEIRNLPGRYIKTTQ